VGYLGLTVGGIGLVLMGLGATPWVLAGGVIIWLGAAAVTMTGFVWTRRGLSEPRPGYWSMRFMLIHDSTHVRPTAPAS